MTILTESPPVPKVQRVFPTAKPSYDNTTHITIEEAETLGYELIGEHEILAEFLSAGMDKDKALRAFDLTAAAKDITATKDAFLALHERGEPIDHPAYLRTLDKLPPEPPRDHPLHRAWSGLAHSTLRDEWKREQGGATEKPERLLRLSEVDKTPPNPVVAPFVHDDGATFLFGDGSAGKSTIGAGLAAVIATQATLSAFQRTGEPRPVFVLPYEHQRGLVRRITGLAGEPDPELIRIIPEQLLIGAIWENADDIRDLIRAEYADHGGMPDGFLFVDSVAFAIGSEGASESSAATLFGSALKRIGLPSIAIAHQTKAGDTMKPFGSVFWHNVPRASWHVGRDAGGIITLTSRKDSEGDMRDQTRELTVEYAETDTYFSDPTDIRIADGTGNSRATRFLAILAYGPLAITEIATADGCDVDTARITLKRYPDYFKNEGGRPALWSARVRTNE